VLSGISGPAMELVPAAFSSGVVPPSAPALFGDLQDPSLQTSGGQRGGFFALPRIAILVAAVLAGSALISAIAVRYVHGVDASKGRANRSTSLVVLPMENLSGDKEQDYFADGMTDDLIANLAKIRSLRVISRSTAMAYKSTHKPLLQIANELNVDAVVEGTVMRAGNRVRITAELVQVSTDQHLWADTYESPIGDVLALQNRVSSAIADQIRINLTKEDRERLAKQPAVSPEAYEDYLKGRYYWNKRSGEGFNRAIGYFEEATRKDPQYALAYAGLAAGLFLPFLPPLLPDVSFSSLAMGFALGLAAALCITGPYLRRSAAFSIADLVGMRFPHPLVRCVVAGIAAGCAVFVALAGYDAALRAFIAVSREVLATSTAIPDSAVPPRLAPARPRTA